jgi:hypothetical protein
MSGLFDAINLGRSAAHLHHFELGSISLLSGLNVALVALTYSLCWYCLWTHRHAEKVNQHTRTHKSVQEASGHYC